MKAGFRSNNLDPNARHCMASAVVAFMQVFGIDEPANVYDDIELADTIVLWGANPAEMHPVLWSRMTDRKLSHKPTRIFNLTTYANISLGHRRRGPHHQAQHRPGASMNYLAREIIARGAVNKDFVQKHCVFATGPGGHRLRHAPRRLKYADPAERHVWPRRWNERSTRTRPRASAAPPGRRSSRRTTANPPASTG
jgi:nitrate reductase NapA